MRVLSVLVMLAALSAISRPATAANAEYQAFLFQACPGATGALAARCAQTIGGAGNVSTDSESSLNPSQSLSHNRATVDQAQLRSAEARDRAEQVRDEGESTSDDAIKVGPFALLLNGRGAQFERERDLATDRERGTEGDSWGAELGLERRLSDRTTLGAIFAYEQVAYDFDAELPGNNFAPAVRAGTTDTDSYSLTMYVSSDLSERAFIEASGGYGRTSHMFGRNSVFQESTRTIAQTDVRTLGETHGDVLWASVNAGYDWTAGAATFGPYVGATWTRSEVDAYTERDLNGSGMNMSFGAARQTSTLVHGGLRFDRTFSVSEAVLVPQLRVEYLYELDSDVPAARAQFALDTQATQYAFAGDEPDSGTVSIGIGFAAILRNGWIWFLNVDHLASGDLDRQRITLGVRAEL